MKRDHYILVKERSKYAAPRSTWEKAWQRIHWATAIDGEGMSYKIDELIFEEI
jgi:hypothetical protein